MRFTQKIFLLFTFLCACSFFKAQNNSIDSLKFVLKNAKHDTARCVILHMLAETASEEEWVAFNEQRLKLAENNLKSANLSKEEYKFYKRQSGEAFCMKGYLENDLGDISKAIDYYGVGLKLFEESGDKERIAYALHQIAYLLQNAGDITKALEYNSKSLKLKEEIGDKFGIAFSLNSIAAIFELQGEYPKALEYLVRSLKLQEEIGDKEGVAQSLNNIGTIYNIQGDPSVKSSGEDSKKAGWLKALKYYERSIKLYEEVGDKKGMATAISNMGVIYGKQGDTKKELEYYSKGLTIRESIGYKKGIAMSLFNFGAAYLKQKNYSEALNYALKSMKISSELKHTEQIRNAAEILGKIYKATGNQKLALENYELFIQMRDSITNEATRKASIKQQLKYDYEKQAAADSVAHAKENEVKNAQLAQQEAEISEKQNQQYALFGGLGLVLVFAGFMFNRFKITQRQKSIIEQKEKETHKQNKIISLQKQEVEEKQEEILDSIRYAKRIQGALMKKESYFNETLQRLQKKI